MLGPLWPTPVSNDDNKSPDAHMAMKRRMPGGPRNTITSLHVAIKAGIEPSTSSPQGIPVNPSLRPGGDWARQMTVISGRQLPGLSVLSGRVGACLRTLLGISDWASTTCWLTWKVLATPGGRRLFRLVPSTPRTGATGFGLWHTPDVPNGGRQPKGGMSSTGMTADGRKRQVGLEQQVKQVESGLWPTPRTEGFDAGAHRENPDSLHAAVKLLPTPHANAATGPGNHGTGGPNLQTVTAGKLSADWVSRMMGFPDVWMDVD